MALHSNAEELKDYIFHNPDQLKNPMFVLAHAPFCAMKLVQNSPDKEIYAGSSWLKELQSFRFGEHIKAKEIVCFKVCRDEVNYVYKENYSMSGCK